MNIRSLCLTALVLGIFFMASAVRADELIISGNAAGSENSINIDSSSQTTVNQQNQMDVNNDVDANANTGGNNTDNGSISTGDANIFVKIKNFFNWNQAEVDCCPEGTTPTPTVYDPGKPTPTPGPIGGESKPPSNGNGGNGGGGGSSGQVLGLSAASGEGTTQMALTTLGLLCLSIGGALVRKPNTHLL